MGRVDEGTATDGGLHMAKKLKVVSEYRAGDVSYPLGEVITVEDDRADFLMRDAPGCFEVYAEPVAKEIKAAPADKMVKHAKTK